MNNYTNLSDRKNKKINIVENKTDFAKAKKKYNNIKNGHSLYVHCDAEDLLLFSILNLKSTNAMDNLIEIYYGIN